MTNLRPHQQAVLNQLGNGKILWGGVGTGKTRVSLAYYMKVEQPKDIYVITTAKVRDSLHWEGEAALFGIGKESNASVAGNLHVDSWNNIDKYSGIQGAFFIFDEQRLVGSGKWVKAFYQIAKKNHWILLSATPGDTWLDYIPVFVANGFYKNMTQFKREHVVYNTFARFPKVDRYVGLNKLTRLRNSILVRIRYETEAEKVSHTVSVDYDREMYDMIVKERWNVLTEAPIRDVGELFVCMRRVVNSDPSRLEAVKALLSQHDKLIVFYSFNYELELLRGLESVTTVAEWNGHRHQEIPKTKKWVYLVQYVAGAEGWNCTETNAMVFYSLTYSYKNWHQAHGRIDRLNTKFPSLFYYVLKSTAPIDQMVWKALSGKKSFQEAKFHNSFKSDGN